MTREEVYIQVLKRLGPPNCQKLLKELRKHTQHSWSGSYFELEAVAHFVQFLGDVRLKVKTKNNCDADFVGNFSRGQTLLINGLHFEVKTHTLVGESGTRSKLSHELLAEIRPRQPDFCASISLSKRFSRADFSKIIHEICEDWVQFKKAGDETAEVRYPDTRSWKVKVTFLRPFAPPGHLIGYAYPIDPKGRLATYLSEARRQFLRGKPNFLVVVSTSDLYASDIDNLTSKEIRQLFSDSEEVSGIIFYCSDRELGPRDYSVRIIRNKHGMWVPSKECIEGLRQALCASISSFPWQGVGLR